MGGSGSHPVGCLGWGVWALEPTVFWVWPGLGEKMAAPGGLMPMSTPQNYCRQCLCLHSEPQPPHASTGDPPVLAGRYGPGSHEVTTSFLGSWCVRYLVCALEEWSFCIPQSCEFLRSNSAGLQTQMLWSLLLLMPDAQAGEPDVGLRTLTPVGELLWYNYFQVCGSPTWQLWDLILSWLRPSHHLDVAYSLSLDIGYLFW